MIKTIFLRRLFLLLLTIIFPIAGTSAQDLTFPAYNGFKIVKEYPVYTQNDLWDYINGAADSYLSLGFNELYIVEYKKGKKLTVKAEIYSHSNNNMAFGIYALERAPSYNFIDIGVQGYRDDDMVHFLKGKYYIKVTTHSKSKKAVTAVYDIASLIDNSIEGSNEMPPTLSLFPEPGRLPDEEMYISENVLGHEFLSKAFKANYSVDGKRFSIYLFTEGGEPVNREMLKIYLGKHGLDPGDAIDGKFMFSDGYNGTIFLAWKSNVTLLITGLSEDYSTTANDYINQILK